MFDEIIACLDGSSLAEKILPLARGITAATGGRLTLLRIVQDSDEFAAEEEYLRDCARQFSADLRFRVSSDAAGAIVAELEQEPRAIAALTTHGRSAWVEAILGSVALRVIRDAKRPLIVFRPIDNLGEAPRKISTIALALDGSRFSEKMIAYGVKAAQALSARLNLIQALPVHPNMAPFTAHQKSDILESSYLHRQAAHIKAAHGVDAQWEVLHGDPADAICRYLSGARETMLAMTTHAREGIERVALGSVAAACVRQGGVPLLLYWPRQ